VQLMRPLIEAARTNGVRQLYSVDLAGNAAMAALARELACIRCAIRAIPIRSFIRSPCEPSL